MNEPSYYVQERGRVSGPFDLDQLREMRRDNRLARFHRISADRQTWFSAETLTEVFRPAHETLPTAPPEPPPPPVAWFCLTGSEVLGPLETSGVQDLVDRGIVGPDTPVRQRESTEWSLCRETGEFHFSLSPAPALSVPAASQPPSPAPASPAPAHPRSHLPNAWLLAWLAVLVGVAASATWLIGSGNVLEFHSNQPSEKPVAHQPSPAPPGDPAPAPPRKLVPVVNRDEPRTRSQSQPRSRPSPAPAPEKPVAQTRIAYVSLPAASTRSPRHDHTDATLAVELPPAPPYSLDLRGLGDREFQAHQLVARPTRPGLATDLTVFSQSGRPGDNLRNQVGSHELARFWIEKDRLHFRWVANKLGRFEEQTALALRECLLVIRGGEVRTKLALRGLVEQPEALTARKGAVSIPWKPLDKPARRVNLLSCQVRRDDKWNDLAETAERNLREWIILPPARGVEPRLVLRVKIAADGSEIRSSLTPSPRQIDRTLQDLANRRQALVRQIEDLETLARNSQTELARMKLALAETSGFLNNALVHLRAKQAGTSRPTNGSPWHLQEAYLEEMNMTQAVNQAQGEQRRLAATIRDYESRFPELSRNMDEVSNRLRSLDDQIQVEKALREEAERDNQAPIRVKLGVVIDGEMIEVARIGPW